MMYKLMGNLNELMWKYFTIGIDKDVSLTGTRKGEVLNEAIPSHLDRLRSYDLESIEVFDDILVQEIPKDIKGRPYFLDIVLLSNIVGKLIYDYPFCSYDLERGNYVNITEQDLLDFPILMKYLLVRPDQFNPNIDFYNVIKGVHTIYNSKTPKYLGTEYRVNSIVFGLANKSITDRLKDHQVYNDILRYLEKVLNSNLMEEGYLEFIINNGTNIDFLNDLTEKLGDPEVKSLLLKRIINLE